MYRKTADILYVVLLVATQVIAIVFYGIYFRHVPPTSEDAQTVINNNFRYSGITRWSRLPGPDLVPHAGRDFTAIVCVPERTARTRKTGTLRDRRSASSKFEAKSIFWRLYGGSVG